MKITFFRFLFFVLLIPSLGGCQTQKLNAQTLAQENLIAESLFQGTIKNHLDQYDRHNAIQTLTNLPIGQEAHWQSKINNRQVTVRPIREFEKDSYFCRRSMVMVEDQDLIEKTYLTICKRDQTWFNPD